MRLIIILSINCIIKQNMESGKQGTENIAPNAQDSPTEIYLIRETVPYKSKSKKTSSLIKLASKGRARCKMSNMSLNRNSEQDGNLRQSSNEPKAKKKWCFNILCA